MLTYTNLYGYVSQCVNVFNTIVSTSVTNPSSTALITGTQQSLQDLHVVTSVSLYSQALTSLLNIYTSVQNLPLSLSSTDQSYINNRITSLNTLISDLNDLLPNISNLNYNDLLNGENIINAPDPVASLWESTFTDAPTGLTLDNFYTEATNELTAWQDLKSAMETQTITWSGSQYDAVNYMIKVIELSINQSQNLTFNSSADPVFCWNSFIFLPNMFSLASVYINNPASFFMQDAVCFRYTVLQTIQKLNQLMLQINAVSSNSALQTATFMTNDSLMTFAARNTGNFEDWDAIVTENNLVPPFIATSPTLNTAYPGESLFLPGNGLVTNSPQPYNYDLDYLGTDIYYGPLNQDMLPWTSDFNIISGISNYEFSLTRALMTSINSLIYENGFGSKIPLLVGNVDSQTTPNDVIAYAESTIMADPRTNSVQNASAVFDSATQTIQYQSFAIPNGSSNAASVNAVI